MKKSVLFVIACCLTMAGMAQEKEWKIALQVSPNISWMKPESKHIESGSNKLQFGFGVMIDKMFTDRYAFGTGLNIFRTGGELSYLYTGGVRKDGAASNTEIIAERVRTYNLQYLEVPLTLKLRTNEIGYITYWAQFGVGLGFNIRSSADEQITYLQEREKTDTTDRWIVSSIKQLTEEDVDIADDIGIFRTSLIMAAGIEYNLSGDASILAGLTFNNGFNNVLTGDGVVKNAAGSAEIIGLKPTSFKLRSINNFVSLNVGILF
jgi:hypothetical protein